MDRVGETGRAMRKSGCLHIASAMCFAMQVARVLGLRYAIQLVVVCWRNGWGRQFVLTPLLKGMCTCVDL